MRVRSLLPIPLRLPVLLPVLLLHQLAGPGVIEAALDPGFAVIDPGRGTIQVATDGDTIYVLKATGQLWERSGSAWSRLHADVGSRALAAGGGALYLLRNNGNIARWRDGVLVTLDPGTRTRQIACGPSGDLYVLKENGQVWRHHQGRFDRIRTAGGGLQIAAGDELYVLVAGGSIRRWDGGTRWTLVDGGVATRQIVADGADLFVLKESGPIWRRRGGLWKRIHAGQGTVQIAAAGGAVHALDRRGVVHARAGEEWVALGQMELVRQIAAYQGGVLALLENGNLLASTGESAGGFRELAGTGDPGNLRSRRP